MILLDRGMRSSDRGHDRAVMSAGGRYQGTRPVSSRCCRHPPARLVGLGALHRLAEANARRKLKFVDPGLYVLQDALLVFSVDRHIPQRPFLPRGLDVLPLRQSGPEAPHHSLLFKEHGVEACPLRVIEAQDTADATANDDEIQRLVDLHRSLPGNGG